MGFESTRRNHDIKRRIAEVLPEKLAGKWEERIRQNTIEKGGYTPLNEMVSFAIDPNFPDDAAIHIHENLTKSPITANRLMLVGLGLLAEKLQTDAGLAHIQRVSGYSWIVYDSPGILEKLGFTVSERDDKKRLALASMDVGDFVRRFGS